MKFDANGWLDEAIEIDYLNKSMSRQGYGITHICLHGTAGGTSAQGIATYFRDGGVDASAHIIIDQAGTVVQGVPLSAAAWGNGILTPGHADYLPGNINPNLYTVSIEHVKASTDNSNPLTDIQKQKSFEVIRCICDTYGIPKRSGDATGGIISHSDIDPINRARCPGPYPFEELWTFLGQEASMGGIPNNWHDDGQTLTAPNGVKVVHGFRDYILSHVWDANNYPLQTEEGRTPLEISNPGLGGGTRQVFRLCTLEWTTDRGVFVAYVGAELLAVEEELKKAASTGVAPGVGDTVILLQIAGTNIATAIKKLSS
jgi:N-acetyl-anhydromuramyl-L-alanine amidase AmpD